MSKRYVALWVVTPFGIAAAVVAIALVTPADVAGAAQVVQAVLVGSTLVVGATLAAVRFGLFREFEPHVVVEQEVTHRPVGASYVHIACAVTIRNTSKVAVRISRAEFSLLTTSHIDDEGAELLHRANFKEGPGGHFQWPALDSFKRDWDGVGLVIEPGSTTVEMSEFIVGKGTRSFVVHSFFENQRHGPTNRGWYATTFYDLMESEPYAVNRSEESLR